MERNFLLNNWKGQIRCSLTKMVNFHSWVLKEKFELVSFGSLICHVVPQNMKLGLRASSVWKICKQLIWRPNSFHAWAIHNFQNNLRKVAMGNQYISPKFYIWDFWSLNKQEGVRLPVWLTQAKNLAFTRCVALKISCWSFLLRLIS